MATMESRVGALEGRADEQATAIADLRTDLREGLADVRTELREGLTDVRGELRDVRGELREGLAAVNARIDRVFLAMLTVGAAVVVSHVGILVTIILRT